jgi:AcrR family transcriptional regulator
MTDPMTAVKDNQDGSSISLRQRQKDLTRELVLQAVASILEEGEMLSFTMQQVAERAGISLRSLYRYFPTREALVEAMYDWVDLHLQMPDSPIVPSTIDELPAMAEKASNLFNKQPRLVRAGVIALLTMKLQPKGREKRNKALEKLANQVTLALPKAEARRAFAVFRHLFGAQAWLSMRDQAGLDGEEAGKAAAWALQTLIEDLKKRNAEAANRSNKVVQSSPKRRRQG